MKARRLFAAVAVEATETLRNLVADLRQELQGERIRWVRLENLHLTVEFFGGTEEGRIPELEKALAKAAAGARPFAMPMGRLGVFGGERHPRVLWMGVESLGLQTVHVVLESALREMGWEPERREFAPHLTLGRIDRLQDARKFKEAMERHRPVAMPEQVVRELILFESVSGRYVPIGRWPLAGL